MFAPRAERFMRGALPMRLRRCRTTTSEALISFCVRKESKDDVAGTSLGLSIFFYFFFFFVCKSSENLQWRVIE